MIAAEGLGECPTCGWVATVEANVFARPARLRTALAAHVEECTGERSTTVDLRDEVIDLRAGPTPDP